MKKIILIFIALILTMQNSFADLSNAEKTIVKNTFGKYEKNLSSEGIIVQIEKLEKLIVGINYQQNNAFVSSKIQDILNELKILGQNKYIDIISNLKGQDLNKYLYRLFTSGIKEEILNIKDENYNRIDVYGLLIKNENLQIENIVGALNLIRNDYNLPSFSYNKLISEASTNHAKYLDNNGDSTAIGHRESKDGNGYTGNKISERMEYVGYKGRAWAEVINYDRNIIKSIKVLLDVPYHRISFISPKYDEIGFPTLDSDLQSVINFGRSETYSKNYPASGVDEIVIYPKNGAKIFDYKGKALLESPDPFPNNHGLVGKAFSLIPSSSNIQIIENSIELIEVDTGSKISIVIAEKNDRDGIHFANLSPLEKDKEYKISFKIKNGNKEESRETFFNTGEK